MTKTLLGRLLLAAMMVMLVLAVSACGQTEPIEPEGQEPTAPAAQFPLQVTDYAQNTITMPAAPERVISLAPSNSEILFAIGAGHLVVGVDDATDYPAEAVDLPRLGGVYGFNSESILDLEPDLVLVIDGMIEERQKLLDLGLTVVVIQPTGFDQILESITMIGQLTGEVAGAESLVTSMQADADRVAAAVAAVSAEERPLVFVEIWDDPLMTVGPGGFVHQLLELAGGINLAADADMEWFMIDEELVIDRDPDVIVTFFAEAKKAIEDGKRSAWQGISAVAEGRIYSVNSDLLVRPGPRIVLGLKDLVEILHPGLLDD